MDPLSQATEVVRQAEIELRQLLLRTAELGDYENARVLAQWAKELKQIIQRDGSADGQPPFGDLPDGRMLAQGEPSSFPTTNGEFASAAMHAPRKAPRPSRRKATRGQYPKFLRDAEELVKIGWSKRTWATYRHKAPKRVVNLVAQALLGKGKSGVRFAMEQVLPIRDPEGAIDVPTYQAYLTLAWLRKEKLVVQHGREGYSLRPQANLIDAIEERWKLLPKS